MFVYASPHKSELNNKRLSLIKNMQNTHRQSIKKRARTQMVRFLSLQTLQSLIAKSQKEFSKEDLALLVQFSNAQFPQAVAFLGNLILEEVVRVSQLELYQLRPGYHPNWLWLIEVLVEKKYCTPQLLQHCIKSLSAKRSIKTRSGALNILYRVTACNMHPPEWITDYNSLLSILNCCLSTHEIQQIAYGLLYQLLNKNSERDINNFSTAVVAEKIVAILVQGSLSNRRKIKILSCKIITQLSLKLIFLPTTYPSVIRLIKQAQSLSYLESVFEMLNIIIERARQEDVLTLIEEGLIVELGILKQICIDEGYEEYIVHKIVLLGRLIDNRTKDAQLHKGVHRELRRFKLLMITDKMDIC